MPQESHDPKGAMLEILKGIHESTFKDHKVVTEEGWQGFILMYPAQAAIIYVDDPRKLT
ncbi:MAG: hypothetical protein ACREBU_00905 [Nitrososphaera sp.]